MTRFQSLIKDLDKILTQCDKSGDWTSYPESPEAWLDRSDLILYLSDGGYTRLGINELDSRVFLADSTQRSRPRWDSEEARRVVTDLNRVITEYVTGSCEGL